MLDAVRKVDYFEYKTAADMQILSRNVKKLISQLPQVKHLYQLPTRHPTPPIISNLCHASRHLSGQQSNPQNLPHFPAQPLNETLEKFLKTVEVHLTEKQLQETKEAAKQFETGIGSELQKHLENAAKHEQNWLASRWLKTAYLSYRDPVTVYSSPGMAFPTQKFNSNEDFLNYAAIVTRSALIYKKLIDNKKLPVERMGKQELDMGQYDKIFGTCRIPCASADKHKYNPKSEHFVVIHKNHFFKVPAFDESGQVVEVAHLAQCFSTILDSVTSPAPAVGILSTDHRDKWSCAYEELEKNHGNRKTLDVIESSLFVVCLDQEVPIKHGQNDMIVTSDQLIHGGGPKQNSGNRWMDKTIQIVVNRNGVNGLCYEHSPAEGQPIAIMTDFILNCVKSEKVQNSGDGKGKSLACRLPFQINDTLEKYIAESSAEVQKLGDNLEMQVLDFKSYGKEFIKSQKLSPDSYIQMAMQYAFFKIHKCPAAQYESAHLRMFVDGRTETIRSCSTESIRFVCGMLNPCSLEERVERLRAAVKAHRDYTMMALQGKGVDRHLLGLKLMAAEHNIPVPEFLKSEAVVKSAHFRMSTSQVASKYMAFMCYGPLTEDGYGCCYNPRDNDIIFAISSWKQNKETSSVVFKRAMQECLESMYELLYCAGEKPKSKL